MARLAEKITPGNAVRVRDGVQMPEFPDLPIGGMRGEVIEVRGRGARQKVIVRWSEAALSGMPDGFAAECDERQLAADLVCLLAIDVELADSGARGDG